MSINWWGCFQIASIMSENGMISETCVTLFINKPVLKNENVLNTVVTVTKNTYKSR